MYSRFTEVRNIIILLEITASKCHIELLSLKVTGSISSASGVMCGSTSSSEWILFIIIFILLLYYVMTIMDIDFFILQKCNKIV